MGRVTATLSDDHEEILEEFVEEHELQSTAAAMRFCITEASECSSEIEALQERIGELESELQAAEARADELRSMATAANRTHEQTQALVKRVEEELEKPWWRRLF
jgi:DNA repair ATPase RecN